MPYNDDVPFREQILAELVVIIYSSVRMIRGSSHKNKRPQNLARRVMFLTYIPYL